MCECHFSFGDFEDSSEGFSLTTNHKLKVIHKNTPNQLLDQSISVQETCDSESTPVMEANNTDKSQNIPVKEVQKEFEHSKNKSEHKNPIIEDHDKTQTKNESENNNSAETITKKVTMSQTVIENEDMTQVNEENIMKDVKKEIVIVKKEEECHLGKAKEIVGEIFAENPVKVTEMKKSSAKQNSSSRKKLPGQSEPGKLPSTSLTSLEFTRVQRKRIASQNFPCYTNRLHTNTKKVKNNYCLNICLYSKCLGN